MPFGLEGFYVRISQKPHVQTLPIFFEYCLWPWPDLLSTIMQYVMYFRFYANVTIVVCVVLQSAACNHEFYKFPAYPPGGTKLLLHVTCLNKLELLMFLLAVLFAKKNKILFYNFMINKRCSVKQSLAI